MKLTETQVSLTKNRFILLLRRYKRNILLVPVIVAALSVFAVLFSHIVTDFDDGIEQEPIGACPMRLQHYSGFDWSEINIAVRLNTPYTEVQLQNNSAQIQYSATVYPITLTDYSLSWSSGNDVIASVDNDGLVAASVPGVTDIYATLDWNGTKVTGASRLNIIQAVEGMYMPTTTITLYKGGSGQMLSAAVSPPNATNQRMSWQSKNDKVATVDETGYVSPVNTGMTEITATSEDGGFTGKCFVNVVNYAVKVENVAIQNSGKDDSYLKVGESFTILAAVQPANAKDKTLKWSSSDTSVASVSQTGVVRALKAGEAFITVASNNGKQDRLCLTVQPADSTGDVLDLSRGTDAATADIVNGSVTYMTYDYTIAEMVEKQSAKLQKYNNAAASAELIKRWADPANFYTGMYKYQFLDLAHPNGTTEAELNRFLADKGILAGHAADFIRAAKEYSVSEIYLIAHACLETGNGTSRLARGVEVNGTTVYNVFGIGAYDNSAVYSGSQRAYALNWTSVGKAIDGGAKWISDNYVNSGAQRQNTLYKMRWNPDNPPNHQYATDIEWATKQALNIERIFEMFPNAVKAYEVPVYSGENAVIVSSE